MYLLKKDALRTNTGAAYGACLLIVSVFDHFGRIVYVGCITNMNSVNRKE